jgi:hypothetical protein
VQKNGMKILVTAPFLIITLLLAWEDLGDFGQLFVWNQIQLVW